MLQRVCSRICECQYSVFANAGIGIRNSQKHVLQIVFLECAVNFFVLWKIRIQFLHVGVHRIARWHRTRFFENNISSNTFSDTNITWFPLVRDLASGRGQPMFTTPTADSRNAIFPRSVVRMVAFAHMTNFLFTEVWVCGLCAPLWGNRNLTSSDILSSWWRVGDPLVTGKQERTNKLFPLQHGASF